MIFYLKLLLNYLCLELIVLAIGILIIVVMGMILIHAK